MLTQQTVADTLINYAVQRDLKQSTLEYYERTVRGFSLWLGRAAVINDLDGDTISEYLTEKKGKASDRYRRNIRNALKALKTFHKQPGDVCIVRVRPHMVQGNTQAELSRLRDVSWRLDIMPDRGKPKAWRAGLLRSVYFRAWLTLLFESCVRPSDVHRIPRCRCRPGKEFGFDFDTAKTGKIVTIQLSEMCCKLIDLVGSDDLAVPQMVSDEVLRDWLAKCSNWAGVEYHARQGIRRTAGTAVEIKKPGEGHKALGNSPAVFNRSYKIRSQIQAEYHGPGEL